MYNCTYIYICNNMSQGQSFEIDHFTKLYRAGKTIENRWCMYMYAWMQVYIPFIRILLTDDRCIFSETQNISYIHVFIDQQKQFNT